MKTTRIVTLLACLLGTGSQAQGAAGNGRVGNEVCPQALDIQNYHEDEKFHLIQGQGRGGWLFGAREFNSYQALNGFLPELRALQEALRARGTELMLVFIPPRAAAQRQDIDLNQAEFRGVNLDELAASYHQAISAVNALGIYAPDLLDLQQRLTPRPDFFFPRDHHWNVSAIRATGDDLAREISARGLLKDVPTQKYSLTSFDQLLFSTYANIAARICGRVALPTTFKALKSEPVGADGALLDDQPIGVVLAGDSNVLRKFGEESFAAYLRYVLQRDVLNVGIEGGGATAALENYLLSEEFRRQPPKLLIWQMDGAYDLRSFLRQVTPAVMGECAAPLRRFTLGSAEVPLEPAVPTGHYLLFQVPDGAVRQFTVSFHAPDGAGWQQVLSHSDRAPHHQDFYTQLDNEVARLQPATPPATPVTVLECAPPADQ